MRKYERPLFQEIASVCGARHRVAANGNDFAAKHNETLDNIEKDLLPSGSGIDCGTTIDRDKSNDDVIVLNTSFHHMNDAGMYDGWTEHVVTIRPAFRGIDITVSGRNRNDIKDYLLEVFDSSLTDAVDYDEETGNWYSVAMREAAAKYREGVANGTII